MQQEIKDLQQENAQMRQQVERLQSDPEAIEHEAREKLHYAKPGEVIVNLPGRRRGNSRQESKLASLSRSLGSLGFPCPSQKSMWARMVDT